MTGYYDLAAMEPGAGEGVQSDQAPGPRADLRRTLSPEARALSPGPPYREDRRALKAGRPSGSPLGSMPAN